MNWGQMKCGREERGKGREGGERRGRGGERERGRGKEREGERGRGEREGERGREGWEGKESPLECQFSILHALTHTTPYSIPI